jgi:hypothetical protein
VADNTFQKIDSSFSILDQAIERLYSLRVSTTPVEESNSLQKPHKSLLLLAPTNQNLGKTSDVCDFSGIISRFVLN